MPKGQFERSEEHKKHISEALKGKAKSPEAIQNMADAKRGTHIDPEKRERMAERMRANPPRLGKTNSESHRAAVSAAHKGQAPQLAKYGITPEQYRNEIENGNVWCCHAKHFVCKEELNSSSVCKVCASDYYRRQDLKRKFGLSLGEYEAILVAQGGGCGICGRGPSAGDRNLSVDHDHATGKTRGVLCTRCNTALERLEEIPDWYINAVKYLARYQ